MTSRRSLLLVVLALVLIAGASGVARAQAVVVAVGRAMHVSGPLHPAVVRRVLLHYRAQVQYCYERGLTFEPELRGTVVVRFTIEPSGAVSASEVASSTVARADVGVCIVARTRTWTFPTTTAPVVVDVPFDLSVVGHRRGTPRK